MQLDRFQPGHVYEVGSMLGAVMLAEQWAEPVEDSSTATVTPLTNVRQFAEAGAFDRWHRRTRKQVRALAADRARAPQRRARNEKRR